MKFSIEDFFSKCDHIFCAVNFPYGLIERLKNVTSKVPIGTNFNPVWRSG